MNRKGLKMDFVALDMYNQRKTDKIADMILDIESGKYKRPSAPIKSTPLLSYIHTNILLF